MDQIRPPRVRPLFLWNAREICAALRVMLRLVLVTLPFLVLRLLFWPRQQPLCEMSDAQLDDIGLSRHDVSRPHERWSPACLRDDAAQGSRGGHCRL